MSETSALANLIKEEYRRLDDEREEFVSTSLLANAVYARIDPRRISPDLVRLAAFLELKQLARGVCRERQTVGERESESGNLFDFQLQPRYPAERDGEDGYVLRHCLTLEERHQNIGRLRHEANAKLAHANALEAETDHLVRTGKLTAEPIVQS